MASKKTEIPSSQIMKWIRDKDLDECQVLQKLESSKAFITKKNLNECLDDATCLMWAVYGLKPRIVQWLLAMGADPTFCTDCGQSVATYWNPDAISKFGDKACEIVIALHEAGAKLQITDYDSPSFDIVKTAYEEGFTSVTDTLKNLGYVYSAEDDEAMHERFRLERHYC